ncbi:MAG: hypothetical protein JSW48_00020 [Betaproteobacteria bacterium]|nr:MAG: hypothetical protein JSW48_00020 [Betaproteobacteria bacterium]
MTARFYLATTLLLAASFLPPTGLAEHHEEGKHHGGEKRHQGHGSKRKSIENLSPELRALFKQEMQALQTGMVSAVPALVTGNLAEVAEIARKMEQSYILRQSITREQMHELHASLPTSFLKLDRAFHYYAGMLAHVADRHKLELVNFYFSKLTESCVTCHSEYAAHKFPGFSGKRDEGDHDHH